MSTHRRFSGHEMSLYVGTSTRKLLRSARIFQIAGYVLAVLVLAGMYRLVIVEQRQYDGGYFEVALGLICGLVLFAGVPWMVGFTKKRQAQQRIYLDGTRLTLVGVIQRSPNVFDLARTRVEVVLVGGSQEDNATKRLAQGKNISVADRDHQIGRGPINPTRQYFVPYHPVLILYRDNDGFAFPIELSHVADRQMRDPAEIQLLERALQYAVDPAGQHAAGQLRTIARWRGLPHITDADPHAIPATPPDHPYDAPVPPTPVRAGTPSPEITLIGAPPAYGGQQYPPSW